MIDEKTYELPETNYFKEQTIKKQIIIAHSSLSEMNHIIKWKHRLNGHYKKTAAFTIDLALRWARTPQGQYFWEDIWYEGHDGYASHNMLGKGFRISAPFREEPEIPAITYSGCVLTTSQEF